MTSRLHRLDVGLGNPEDSRRIGVYQWPVEDSGAGAAAIVTNAHWYQQKRGDGGLVSPFARVLACYSNGYHPGEEVSAKTLREPCYIYLLRGNARRRPPVDTLYAIKLET